MTFARSMRTYASPVVPPGLKRRVSAPVHAALDRQPLPHSMSGTAPTPAPLREIDRARSGKMEDASTARPACRDEHRLERRGIVLWAFPPV